MAVFSVKQLGQLRPANTTAASLYSPAANTNAILKTLVVCNQTAAPADYRVFHDDNGTTYDETTALFFDVTLAANVTDVIPLNAGMNDSTGNFAVRTDTNNALTFTLYGSETPIL
jgi:hypothetical protein|tara:strand:- start:2462 stop:2806 length:345 start_codon:yes stop_codon:yes gene_type:complete